MYRQRLLNTNITPGQLNKSYLQSNIWLYVLAFLSIGVFIIIIINLLSTHSKACAADKSEIKMLFSNNNFVGFSKEIFSLFEKTN